MINIYKSSLDGKLIEIQEYEVDCWINMVAPTESELLEVSRKYNVDKDFLLAALDDEEHSRIEIDNENSTTLILVDSPIMEKEIERSVYNTIPIAIIHTKQVVITVCLRENVVFQSFKTGTVKTFFTYKKSRFILQILYGNAMLFLKDLKQIDKLSEEVESRLHISMKNKELIQLLDLQKSLVYFSTSLRANGMVLRRLTRLSFMNLYAEDKELLEDTVIENEQAVEMSKIYTDILSGTMNAYSSVISNNLNIVMKLLTSITIVMAIPTMIYSFYGMNVSSLPFVDRADGYLIIFIFSVISCLISIIIMAKKKMF